MFFSEVKLRYKRLLFIIIPLFVALIVCGFFTYRTISSQLGTGSTSSKKEYDIDSMDYHLRSNATDYQKELFSELRKLVEDGTDDQALAESVVKNYIADIYTWDNKKGQWDVGGMGYVYSPMRANIYYKARDGFYAFVSKYIEEYGSDGLLEVTNIEIVSSEKMNDKFSVDGNSYEYYHIVAKWDYANDSRFASDVDNRMEYDVVKRDSGRFEIVVSYESE